MSINRYFFFCAHYLRRIAVDSRFSPLLKNQYFQIPIRTKNQVDEEPLCGSATSKSLFIYLF